MAGDWIKMRKDLPGDPAVCVIAGHLNISHDEAIGKLFRFWCWVDSHVKDGNASSVTPSFLDMVVGETHFTEAMVKAGWLETNGDGFMIPNFERHMSQGAKTRALTSTRVGKYRVKSRNASVTLKALPEKRREEKKNKRGKPTPASDGPEETKPPKPPDPVWDAVVALFHPSGVPDNGRSSVGRAVAELKRLGATPDMIRERYNAAVAAEWGVFSVHALVKHWDALARRKGATAVPPDPWMAGLYGDDITRARSLRDRAKAEGVLDAFLRRVPRGSACGPSVAWAIDAAGSVKAWMETNKET